MSAIPTISAEISGERARIFLSGPWTIVAPDVERRADEVVARAGGAHDVVLDLAGVDAMDTAGAWLIGKSLARIAGVGADARIEGARHEHAILLRESAWRDFGTAVPRKVDLLHDFLTVIGRNIAFSFSDLFNGIAFLGRIIVTLVRAFAQPWRLRGVSIVAQIERFGWQGAPIIALINFIVGGIVAQQGIYQLRRFGAPTYAIDLIGILVLRELGVFLTSIMVAGRSGSSITAELGSMKMREEIDALRVMGLDPVEVLVAPRVLALLISLPLLTFIGDMAALFGGLLVSWSYQGIAPIAFLELLKEAIGFNTFMVGLIKAPFMALVIGMIAAIEGFATQGSAESLGNQVTASVVKSIFMIIVLDGLFAVYFAAIHY